MLETNFLHEIDEDGQIMLNNVDTDTLGDEGTKSGEHLVQSRVAGQTLECFCSSAFVTADTSFGDFFVVELLFHT